MNMEIQDEVVEERWEIKDQFAVSGGGNAGELIKRVDEMAKQKDSQCDSINVFASLGVN